MTDKGQGSTKNAKSALNCSQTDFKAINRVATAFDTVRQHSILYEHYTFWAIAMQLPANICPMHSHCISLTMLYVNIASVLAHLPMPDKKRNSCSKSFFTPIQQPLEVMAESYLMQPLPTIGDTSTVFPLNMNGYSVHGF